MPQIRIASTLRVLALVGLFLLPMQMRAGTVYVHPHALLHLLLDAADSEIDHHAGEAAPAQGQSDHSDPPLRREAASPDLPTFESIQMAAGGLAVALVTQAFFLITITRERVCPRRETWIGRHVSPDSPPPRISAA